MNLGKFTELNGVGYIILVEFDPSIHKYLLIILYFSYVCNIILLNIQKIKQIR